MLVGVTMALAAAAVPEVADMWANKVETGHTIRLERVVDAAPDVVYRLWTTSEGASGFLAPRVSIEAHVGGEYRAMFDPKGDPEGEVRGTRWARILRLVPGREVDFEWRMAPWGEGPGAHPNPSWVEITLTPADGAGSRTRVRLAHYGFRDDDEWQNAFAAFRDEHWPLVLDRLVSYCRELPKPGSD